MHSTQSFPASNGSHYRKAEQAHSAGYCQQLEYKRGYVRTYILLLPTPAANPLNLPTNRLSHLPRPCTPPHIPRPRLRIPRHILNSLHKLVRHSIQLPIAQPPHHFRRGPKGTDGVRDPFSCDIGRGAMDGFEHGGAGARGVEVGGGGYADGACKGSGEVGEDVCVYYTPLSQQVTTGAA